MSVDAQLKARAVYDARTLGRKEAAKRHNVSMRTLDRWIARSGSDPEIASEVETLAKAVHEPFIKEAREFARACLAKVKQAVDELDQAKLGTKEIRDLVEASTRAGELVMAHGLVFGEEADEDDGGPHGSAKERSRW